MATTDGSTTKAKGKKAKAPKAKAKKNGNGSKTVTLVLDEGTTKVQAEETVSKAQFDALQKQMAEILAKFGPMMQSAESKPVEITVPPGATADALVQAVAEAGANTASSTEIVPPKPKKKYTKKPKAQIVVETPPTKQEAVVLEGQPVVLEPAQPGPQMDTAALMKKLSETPPPPLIEKYAEPKMAYPGPVTLFGGKAKGKGTGGDLVLNPDGSPKLIDAAAHLKDKVATQVEKLVDTSLTYNKDGIPEFGLEPFVLTDGTISKAFALPGGKVIFYNPKLVNLPEHPYEPVPGELPKLVEKPPEQAQTTATITKQFGKDSSKQEVTEETIAVHTFITQPAVVGVEAGLTINLGNYESARITVSISVPCYAEERDAAYTEACKWVEERISKQRDAIVTAKNATGF